MKVRPLFDKILVTRVEEEKVTKGGIHIPDTATEKPMQARVVAVGPDCVLVKPKDLVLFQKYGGAEVRINDVDHLILSEEEVLCIFEKR